MAGGARAHVGQDGEEDEDREEQPTVRRPQRKPESVAAAAETKTAKNRAWWSQRNGLVSTTRNWTSRPNAKFDRNRTAATQKSVVARYIKQTVL